MPRTTKTSKSCYRPRQNRVDNITAGIETIAGVIEEIRDFEKEIKKEIVAAYIDVQCNRYEDFLNLYSSYPSKSRMVRLLIFYVDTKLLFSIAQSYWESYAAYRKQLPFVRENTQKNVWDTLDDFTKNEVQSMLLSMEKLLKETPDRLRTSQKQELEDARDSARFKYPVSLYCSKVCNRYQKILLEFLQSEGVAYWHQSRKVAVQDTIDFSTLSRSQIVMHDETWRLMSEEYAVKMIDAAGIDNHVLILPSSYEFHQFFNAIQLDVDESAKITLFAEKEVYTGTLTRLPYFSSRGDYIVILTLDSSFRIDPEIFENVPDGCEASLVFVPMAGVMNAYKVAVMHLPVDAVRKKLNVRTEEMYEEIVCLYRPPFSEPLTCTAEEVMRYESGSQFLDGSAVTPAMLLDADVRLDWALFSRNAAVYALSPKKFFTGRISVSEWAFPFFHPDVPDRAGYDRLLFICQGTVYTGMLTYLVRGWGAELAFPIGLVKLIYKQMEVFSSGHHPYGMLLFEQVKANVFLLHFGYADESLSLIRNHNPSWQLKAFPRVRASVAAPCLSPSVSKSLFSSEAEIIMFFAACGSGLLKDYDQDPGAVLSFFMQRCSPEWYIVFRERLDERIRDRDLRRNRGKIPEPVFVPQKVELDWDRVRSAADDLNETAELLGVAYDDADDGKSVSSIVDKFEESGSAPIVALSEDDAWRPFVSALSPAQSAFLLVMLNDPENTGELKRLANQEGKILDICFDELNELAVENFGDVLIDDGAVIDEYRDDLIRAMKTG